MTEKFRSGHEKETPSTIERRLEKPGRIATQQLESAMGAWEDQALMAAVHTQLVIATGQLNVEHFSGALSNWRDLRSFMLKNGHPQNPLPDLQKFQITPEQKQAERRMLTEHRTVRGQELTPENTVGPVNLVDNYFVPQLLAWTRSSRRVFSLDAESTRAFTQIPHTMKWSDDVLLPFDSFSIEIHNSPIQVRSGNRTFLADTIMVTNLHAVNPAYPPGKLQCRVFFTDQDIKQPAGLAPLMPAYMRNLAMKIYEGKFSQEDVNAYSDALDTNFADDAISPLGKPFEISLDDETIYDDTLQPLTNITRQIVAGLCMYLASTPDVTPGEQDIRGETWHQNAAQSGKKKQTKGITPRQVVTEESQVLKIQKVHVFNPQTNHITYTDNEGRIVDAHARRAHKRRRPNTEPDAPKNVEVKATWVHIQYIPRDALPPGTATVIT